MGSLGRVRCVYPKLPDNIANQTMILDDVLHVLDKLAPGAHFHRAKSTISRARQDGQVKYQQFKTTTLYYTPKSVLDFLKKKDSTVIHRPGRQPKQKQRDSGDSRIHALESKMDTIQADLSKLVKALGG